MVLRLLGVMSSQAPLPEGLETPDRPGPRLVAEGPLAAIVTEAPADAPAGRQDLLGHAHVLEACAAQTTVIPVQFGIALEDDEQVRQELLRAQREDLLHLLGVFEGLEQVTVQVFLDEERALREVLDRYPDLAAQRGEVDPGAGAPSPEMVELGRAVASALDQLADELRAEVLGRLAPLARAVSDAEPGSALEVIHAALLVERQARPALDEAVGALRDDYGARLQVRYVGPQPPYSFLEAARNGELAWD